MKEASDKPSPSSSDTLGAVPAPSGNQSPALSSSSRSQRSKENVGKSAKVVYSARSLLTDSHSDSGLDSNDEDEPESSAVVNQSSCEPSKFRMPITKKDANPFFDRYSVGARKDTKIHIQKSHFYLAKQLTELVLGPAQMLAHLDQLEIGATQLQAMFISLARKKIEENFSPADAAKNTTTSKAKKPVRAIPVATKRKRGVVAGANGEEYQDDQPLKKAIRLWQASLIRLPPTKRKCPAKDEGEGEADQTSQDDHPSRQEPRTRPQERPRSQSLLQLPQTHQLPSANPSLTATGNRSLPKPRNPRRKRTAPGALTRLSSPLLGNGNTFSTSRSEMSATANKAALACIYGTNPDR